MAVSWVRRFAFLSLLFATQANAQIACVPNPNASGPPFFNGCNVPASGLNMLFLTPMAFGAVGNGTTDDTAAVQAAITAASAAGLPLKFDLQHLYKISSTLNVSAPIDMEGPARYGIWTTTATNSGRSCPWGLTTTMNQTLLNVTAITGTFRNLCLQLGAATGSGVSATAGAGIAFAPPSTVTYQAGITAEYNTIINPYDGITVNGAGYSASCCGAGSDADGVFIARNTIVNPADVGISIGKNTAGAETVGITVWDNAINCVNATSKASGTGVAIYDGGIDYDGTENGPLGCNIGVAVIPGTVSGVGQNAELNPAKGVLGDQSATHDLLIQTQTTLAVVGFVEIHSGWTGGTQSGDNEVLISNSGGGMIAGVKFDGGFYHSALSQTVPIVDIEGNSAGTGTMGDITIVGASIDCWGGSGTCTAPNLKINGAGSSQPVKMTVAGNHIGNNYEAGQGAQASTGIQITGSGVGFLAITGNDISDPTTPISFTPTNSNQRILFAGNAGVDDVCTTSIASSASVSLQNADSCAHLTGTTSVTQINNPWSARTIRVIADNGLTLNTGGSSPALCTAVTLAAKQQTILNWDVTNGCWGHP